MRFISHPFCRYAVCCSQVKSMSEIALYYRERSAFLDPFALHSDNCIARSWMTRCLALQHKSMKWSGAYRRFLTSISNLTTHYFPTSARQMRPRAVAKCGGEVTSPKQSRPSQPVTGHLDLLSSYWPLLTPEPSNCAATSNGIDVDGCAGASDGAFAAAREAASASSRCLH